MESKAIDDMVHYLNEKFKTKSNYLTVYKGKVHNYLGVNTDYNNNNYVKFTMYEFIEDMFKEARDNMNRLSPWLSYNKLFNMDCASPCLSGQNVDYLHRITTQLLFA